MKTRSGLRSIQEIFGYAKASEQREALAGELNGERKKSWSSGHVPMGCPAHPGWVTVEDNRGVLDNPVQNLRGGYFERL
jgi:hypothetical protein